MKLTTKYRMIRFFVLWPPSQRLPPMQRLDRDGNGGQQGREALGAGSKLPWAEYTAALRAYKQSEHFIVYARLHNSPEKASSEQDFMRVPSRFAGHRDAHQRRQLLEVRRRRYGRHARERGRRCFTRSIMPHARKSFADIQALGCLSGSGCRRRRRQRHGRLLVYDRPAGDGRHGPHRREIRCGEIRRPAPRLRGQPAVAGCCRPSQGRFCRPSIRRNSKCAGGEGSG